MVKLKGGETQDEVLAIALMKLELEASDTIADIGCGTGKVSIAASRWVQHVYAVDRSPEAIRHASEAAGRQKVGNITFVEAEAVDFLKRIGHLDGAFVGGSRSLPEVLRSLADKTEGRIVVNAVLLRTLHAAVSVMRELGIFREALQIQVSRSCILSDDLMFRPLDPVFMIVGEA